MNINLTEEEVLYLLYVLQEHAKTGALYNGGDLEVLYFNRTKSKLESLGDTK